MKKFGLILISFIFISILQEKLTFKILAATACQSAGYFCEPSNCASGQTEQFGNLDFSCSNMGSRYICCSPSTNNQPTNTSSTSTTSNSNKCSLGQAKIGISYCGKGVLFSPTSAKTGQSITATVCAYNAQRVDVVVYGPASSSTPIFNQNGGMCTGTTCKYAFSANHGVGTYTVKFNAWDLCTGNIDNHIASNSIAVTSSSTTTCKAPNGTTVQNGQQCPQTASLCWNGACTGGCGHNPSGCFRGYTCINGACTASSGMVGTTAATVAFYFEGIDGNNNTSPTHLTRQLTLYFYKNQTYGSDLTGAHADYKASDVLTLNSTPDTNGNNFYWINSNFSLKNVPAGSYYILAKSPEGSLRLLLSTSKIPIVNNTNNILINPLSTQATIPTLLVGDLNNDNKIDILDYNILLGCYGYKGNSFPSNCPTAGISDTTKGLFADLNDDNVVDGIDYNMLLRHYGASGF